ncbi:astacin-like metalloendopeptidase [Heteronotia binoei]|uniref:astacin-like metalloendopeptidase n=1 Tax=Heteronotia binoei TaxID=13085 RepID=UPI002930AD27|nr:astacin-like metalloendopeptidase [Heteronotia binoei]
MGVPFDSWPASCVFFWLWLALLLNSHEAVFQKEDNQENNLPEASGSQDDILDINQALIPLEAPESSFLLEGDIIKARPFRLFSSANPRWPKKGGIVQIPYVISHKYDKPSVRIIQEAFEDFAKFTCIKFIPYSYQRDFVSIVPLSGCFSSVGRIGGMQVVSLAPACLRRGKGVALHEFMHILGFWHEHSRADRDKYITISWNEILTGFEINFMKSWNTNMLVDYDYSSVMHYGRNAFSRIGLPTITPLSSSHAFLGQRWNLSSSDIARVNKLYKCSQVALQPETSTEKILQEKIKDFIPHEPEPCSTVSQIKLSSAQSLGSITEATEMAHPARETLQKPEDQTKVDIDLMLNKPTGKGSDATGTPTTKIPLAAILTQERHGQTQEAASKLEYLTVAQEVPPETQPTETELQVDQKSTLWQALEKPTSSAKELKTKASDFEGAYSASQQKTTEAMSRTAPQVKHSTSFGIRSPPSLLNEIVQIMATRPSEKALYWPLPSKRATHAEYATETSTIETRGLPIMQSSESEDINGPLHSTEGYPFTMMENQSEESAQQSVSSSENELGNFTDVPLMEGVQAKATISVHATTSPRAENSAAASHAARVEATISSDARSQASFTTGILSGTAEEEVGSSYRTKERRPVYIQHSSTRRSSLTSDFEQMPYTEETLALGSPEVQDNHLGQIGATATATSSWAPITSHFAASRRKEVSLSPSGPTVPSEEMGWSSLPPGSLTREGGREENVTPSGFLFETEWIQATEMPMKSGQAPTKINSYSFTEPTSLAMETNQVILPTERTALLRSSWSQDPGLPEPRESLILQPRSTAKYSLRALVGSLATPTGIQAEEAQAKQTIETVFATAMQSMSVEPKVTVSQREETESKIPAGTEETEAHGKESMQGALTSESVQSQMPSNTQAGWAETPQSHTDFSLVTGITGAQNGDTQARLKRATSPKQEMMVSSSGAKFSGMELKTKGLSFLDRQFKLGSTSQPSPGTEIKEPSSILEGIFLPVHETRTDLSGSKNPTKSTGFGNSVEDLKETTSSAMSKQEYTVPYKRKISEITITNEETSGVSAIGSSSFSTTLALGNQTLKYTEEQTKPPPLWNMQSTGSPESLSPQFLSKFSSKPREMSPFAEEEPINLVNATEEMLLGVKWATADAEKDLVQRTTVPPLDKQSTAMTQATIKGTTLPLTTDLLQSPKIVTYGGETAAISSIKKTPPSTVGITTASTVYSATAVPVQTLEIQASIPVETRDHTSRATKKSEEAGLETYTGTEIYRMPSTRASSLGLHEGHAISTAESKVIGIPQVSQEPEITWPTYKTAEGRQTKAFLEKGKSGVSVLREKITAVTLGLGSETTAQNGGDIIATITPAAKLTSQSGYTQFSPSFMEEPTIIHGKKVAMNISVGPTRKLVLEMMGSPNPGDRRTTEMALSVPERQNNLDSEKTKTTLHLEISSKGMYLTDMESTEGITATTGVSLVDSQTLSPNEVRIQLKYHRPHGSQGPNRENGYNGLFPIKGSPLVTGNGELLGPSAEASMPASATHTALRQEEIIQTKAVVPEQKTRSSVDNPTADHQLD